jgi:cAMP-dependent protein kinase regulator
MTASPSWTSPPHQSAIEELIEGAHFARAANLLRSQLERRPNAVSLRLQLADVFVRAARIPEAVTVLLGLADDLGRAGLPAQAISVLKRVQGLDQGRTDIEERVAGAIEQGREALEPVPGADTPLFRGFSHAELLAVIRGLRHLTYVPGDIIVSEGEPGDSLFILTAGQVKAFTRRPDGHNDHVRDLREGDFFGEVSVLRGTPRTATITAASPCELLLLDRATVDAIAAAHPQVPRVLQEFCAQRAGANG